MLPVSVSKRAPWVASCRLLGLKAPGATRESALAALGELVGPGVRVADGRLDADDLRPIIAKLLRHQRESRDLSLADVGKQLGTTRANYAAYEAGKRDPSVSQLRALLRAIDPSLALVVRG